MEKTEKIIVYRNRREEFWDSDEGQVLIAYGCGLFLAIVVIALIAQKVFKRR